MLKNLIFKWCSVKKNNFFFFYFLLKAPSFWNRHFSVFLNWIVFFFKLYFFKKHNRFLNAKIYVFTFKSEFKKMMNKIHSDFYNKVLIISMVYYNQLKRSILLVICSKQPLIRPSSSYSPQKMLQLKLRYL